MPYTVFALKWRPQNFDAVIGQKHIVDNLKNTLKNKRLAHAYLFAGPRGVGKTSTARILAKALNCKDGPTISPCGKCNSCLEISLGRSLDVIEIDGASNRGIDEIRTLRENVKFSPVNGKFKIYIVDEVHMLTTEAFNALLKTLEEPPEFVKFIFATTQPHKVIPTILSRCQRFDFRRISVIETIAQLEKIIASEGIRLDKDILLAIAKSSDGSLRDAESVLDQVVSIAQDKISLNDVIALLGLVEQEILFEITDNIIKKDALATLGLLNRIIDSGKDTATFLANLIEHFRNLMVAKIANADNRLIDLPQEYCQQLSEQAKSFSMEEIFNAFNILVNAQEMSKRLDSVRIPLEISLVKMAHDKKGASSAIPPSQPQPPKHNIPAAQPKKTEEPGVLTETKQSNPPVPENPVKLISLEEIKSAWENIVQGLGKIKMSVATYLNEGSPLRLENNILTVAFPMEYSLHKESLESNENRAIIEKIASELFNASLRVKFILSQDLSPRQDDTNNPFIKNILDTFKGRLIKEG